MTSFVPKVVQDQRQTVSRQRGAGARQRPGAAALQGICVPFPRALPPGDPPPRPRAALASSPRRAGVLPARDEQTNRENAAQQELPLCPPFGGRQPLGSGAFRYVLFRKEPIETSYVFAREENLQGWVGLFLIFKSPCSHHNCIDDFCAAPFRTSCQLSFPFILFQALI